MKLKCDELLSSFAFNFNLCRYKKAAGDNKFTFKAWAEGKAWINKYYVHVDYYLDVETGAIEDAFRHQFENFDKSLKVTAVGTDASGAVQVEPWLTALGFSPCN